MDLGAVHSPFLHRLHLRRRQVDRFLARTLERPGTRARFRLTLLAAACALLAACADTRHVLVIDVPAQRLTLLEDGVPIAAYPVSTSKYGVGDALHSNQTPAGLLRVKKKIGDGAPAGAVFKSRKPTGEILPPDAPGRDPVVTRILWLDGLEARNRNASARFIYIHGTPEERNIGTPASYGCIRMRSRDIIDLYDRIGVGARVRIDEE